MTSHRMLIVCALPFGLLGVFPLLAGPKKKATFAPPPLTVDLSFTVYSEAIEPIAGGRVMVKTPTTTKVLLTQANGVTPQIASAVGNVYDVYLKTKTTTFGTALGQAVRGWSVPDAVIDLSGCDSRDWECIFTQPTLRRILWDSTRTKIQSNRDTLWYLAQDPAVEDPAVFAFTANVGSLSSHESIYRYLDYAGVAPLEENYRYAVGIQTTDIESLGDQGALLVVKAQTLGFASPPIVDVYLIAADDADMGHSTLKVSGYSENEGTLTLGLAGDIGKGVTLLLFREGSESYGLVEFLASPPSFPPPTQPGGNPIAANTECLPPQPGNPDDPSQLNRPTPPEQCGHGDCPFPPEPVGDPMIVGTQWRSIGPKTCTDGNGGSNNAGQTISWGGSVSATFKLGPNVQIAAGGNVSSTESVSANGSLGAGQDCGGGTHGGQCGQWYRRRTVVEQDWLCERPLYGPAYGGPFSAPAPGVFLSCYDDENPTYALDEANIHSTCNRPCQ